MTKKSSKVMEQVYGLHYKSSEVIKLVIGLHCECLGNIQEVYWSGQASDGALSRKS